MSEFFFPDQNLNYNIELANYFNQCKLFPGKIGSKDFANKPSITFSAFLKVTNEMGGGQNIKRYFAKMQKKYLQSFWFTKDIFKKDFHMKENLLFRKIHMTEICMQPLRWHSVVPS